MQNRWLVLLVCGTILALLSFVVTAQSNDAARAIDDAWSNNTARSNDAAWSNNAVERVVHIKAKKFEFSPAEITAKKGEPLVLEIESADVKHGFSLPDFGVRTDVKAGAVTRVSLTPNKTGKFAFACDVFCGSGHEDMSGLLTVTD